jgi:DNA-binding FadR family transcriptional regulator
MPALRSVPDAPRRAGARADDALLRPVRQGNAFEETIERVLQVIKLGVVGVGERLPPERDLSLRLHVSRVTLREAIRTLQEAGYVESRRGRYGGTFVRAVPPTPQPGHPASAGATATATATATKPTAESLDDMLTFRHVVETGAAEHAAARRLTEAEVAHLQRLLDLTTEAEPAQYRRCDSRLHLAVAELSGSTSVTAAVADARTALNAQLDAIPLLTHNIRHSDRQHRRIVEAVLSGQPVVARAVMEEHLAGTAALLRAFLQ